MCETQVAEGRQRGLALDTEGCTLVSLLSPPSLVSQPGALKVSSWFTQCRRDLSYKWLLLLLAKAATDNTGEELALKQTDWIAGRELELGIYQTDSTRAVVSHLQGRHLEKARALQQPRTQWEPLHLAASNYWHYPQTGDLSEALFLIFSGLNANPFNKTVPDAFSALFSLNLFLPVEKKKKIPVSLVWPHLDLHWFSPCHSCYQQELAYGFKGKLRRRKERRHFDGNKGQRNNLPSTKKLICVWFPKQSLEKPMLILGYTKKP